MQRSFTFVFLLIVCFVLSVGALAAQDAPTPEPVGLRPDAPQYALHGPYWVGTADFTTDVGRNAPLVIHAWYPALNPDGAAEEIDYLASIKEYDRAADLPSTLRIAGHALPNAAVDFSAAPYPLIVFSAGFGNTPYAYAGMLEHWASQGFVILAPEHQERFDWALTDQAKGLAHRPQDIRAVLDYAESRTTETGAAQGLMDMDHVAVAGHSGGGYTTLAMGGAQIDLAGMRRRCEAAASAGDPNAAICDMTLPVMGEVAGLVGLDSAPDGLWPSFGDPRVDAIIPMAGDSYLFDQAGLAEITIPVMAIGGTTDNGTPFDWGARPAFEYASSAQKVLVGIENADHLIFGLKIDEAPAILDTMLGPYYLDPVWDKDRAHDLINHFTTAFLLSTLKGDADAAAALSPNAVAFPGIEYRAEGF